jgi:Flp pilus assembly pilin Flp
VGNLRKAFLAIEYTILIAVLIAALIGISVYLRRAISGKWRDAADTFGFGRQYYPAETQCFDESGSPISCED